MRIGRFVLLAVMVSACLALKTDLKRLQTPKKKQLEPVYLFKKCSVHEPKNKTMERVDSISSIDFGADFDDDTYTLTVTDAAKHIKACHDLWQWKEYLEPCLADDDSSARSRLNVIGEYIMRYECVTDASVARFIWSEQSHSSPNHDDLKH